MKGKRLAILVIAMCVLAVMVAIWQAGGGEEPSSTAVSLSEPAMAKTVNQVTAEPIEVADVFTPDTPIIYCTVKLSNASDAEVKARWIYVGSEADDVRNDLLYEIAETFNGTRYLSFSLVNDTEWPKGEYKVVLYLNNKEKLSVPFTVQ